MPEYIVSIKIEKLDEGVYLATSDNLQGLVAQDVARKLIESYVEYGDPLPEGIVPPARVVRNIKIPVAVTV